MFYIVIAIYFSILLMITLFRAMILLKLKFKVTNQLETFVI